MKFYDVRWEIQPHKYNPVSKLAMLTSIFTWKHPKWKINLKTAIGGNLYAKLARKQLILPLKMKSVPNFLEHPDSSL